MEETLILLALTSIIPHLDCQLCHVKKIICDNGPEPVVFMSTCHDEHVRGWDCGKSVK